jgi:HD-GYP domain-containing protein (c-di-GMP phosphodiesterase class II)
MSKRNRNGMGEFAEAVERADRRVPGHSERVAQLSTAVAAEMGLDGAAIETIRHAAALHDIGKVSLSSDIVGKLGKLTDEEFGVMKLHATIGLGLIERANGLRNAAPLVKHHHERVDGTGYPDGLKGDEIPLGSRIIAVCEAYDMMTAELAYQSAKTPDEALAELRRCAGTQFDPGVVESFARVLASMRASERARRAA